jgi:hypothetical protein
MMCVEKSLAEFQKVLVMQWYKRTNYWVGFVPLHNFGGGGDNFLAASYSTGVGRKMLAIFVGDFYARWYFPLGGGMVKTTMRSKR